MLFVLNKNKIISYTIAASVVVILFVFSISLMPNSEIQLMQVSSNITISDNNILDNNIQKDSKKNNIYH